MCAWYKLSSDQKQELTEFQRWCKRIATVLTLIGAIIPVVTVYMSRLPPLKFDALSTEERDNLDDIPTFHLLNSQKEFYSLEKCYPLANAPYVYCHFINDLTDKDSKGFRFQFKDKVIDIDKGKIVLGFDWENWSPKVDYNRYSRSQVENKGLYLSNNQPQFLLTRQARHIPDFVQTLGDPFESVLRHLVRPRWEMWTVDLSGKTTKLTEPPEFFYYDQSSFQPIDFTKVLAIGSNLLYEYEIQNGALKETHHWPEPVLVTCPLFHLPDGGYLYNKWNKNSVLILHRNAPQTIQLSLDSLVKLLPSPPDHFPKKLILVPITFAKGTTVLAYLHAPNYPIFEIRLDRLEEKALENRVRFLGYGVNWKPQIALNDNRTILFHQADIAIPQKDGTYLFPKYYKVGNFFAYNLSYAQTDSLPQSPTIDSASSFVSYLLPDPLLDVSNIPLDDSRLLAHTETTFWTFKWDGTDIRQVFPREPVVPLKERTLPPVDSVLVKMKNRPKPETPPSVEKSSSIHLDPKVKSGIPVH